MLSCSSILTVQQESVGCSVLCFKWLLCTDSNLRTLLLALRFSESRKLKSILHCSCLITGRGIWHSSIRGLRSVKSLWCPLWCSIVRGRWFTCFCWWMLFVLWWWVVRVELLVWWWCLIMRLVGLCRRLPKKNSSGSVNVQTITYKSSNGDHKKNENGTNNCANCENRDAGAVILACLVTTVFFASAIRILEARVPNASRTIFAFFVTAILVDTAIRVRPAALPLTTWSVYA